MARDHAAIRLDIWGDDDWRALTLPAQHLYLHLLSSPSLNYAGVADWRPARIAGLTAGATPESVREAADELEKALFIIRDEDTEEVLIRSYLKHDGLLHKPNVAKAMVSAFGRTVSADLRGVIVFELRKLYEKNPEWHAFSLGDVSDIIGKGSVNPSELVSERLRKGSGKGSVKGSEKLAPLLTPNSLLLTPNSTHLTTSANEVRDDILTICNLLADLIESNGSKRPTIGKAWTEAARHILDTDKRDVKRVEHLIRWCQQDEFWRSNILSMGKFREKFDQMRLQSDKAGVRASSVMSIGELRAHREKMMSPPASPNGDSDRSRFCEHFYLKSECETCAVTS